MKRAVVLAIAALLGACSKEAPPPAASSPTPAPPPPPAPDPPPIASAAPAASTSAAPMTAGDGGTGKDEVPDIEYVPTPENVVAKMLEVAKIQKDDVLYDLGCGDGRIVVTAAKKFGIRGVGFDVDSRRIKESNENAKRNGVENLVRFEKRNIFEVDLSPASVVTLYCCRSSTCSSSRSSTS